MTTVVNVRSADYDIYIGRPGPLGNPFRIGQHGTREEVIRLHMQYARDRILHDPEYKRIVAACYGKRLGCYCSPLPCHGDNYVILSKELHDAQKGAHSGPPVT